MWCCQHRQAGCGAERQFDCLAGYNNWKQGWSSKKKVFCCDNFQLACEREGDQYDNLEEIAFSVNDEYDCKAGFANWQRGWSDDKKGFCCGKYKIGCPPGWKENQMHFGTHWSSDWSKLDHHVWATAKAEPHESHESQSHEFHESHDGSPQHYDCVTDYEHWKVSWSSKRAKFCYLALEKGDIPLGYLRFLSTTRKLQQVFDCHDGSHICNFKSYIYSIL
eukprot:Skav223844  [mRNA]  locus=scaffold2304:199076:199735:+ [translate_table: standard]